MADPPGLRSDKIAHSFEDISWFAAAVARRSVGLDLIGLQSGEHCKL